MRVYLAEKREVARAISVALEGESRAAEGFFTVGADRVTWLSGHLLRLIDPEEHDPELKPWKLESLPMVWPIRYAPIEGREAHLKRVIGLCRGADELVHAGDPDPEGQRLVDEVIEYGELTRIPCRRVLINDNTPEAIRRAMEQLEDNRVYRGLSRSALARAVCDQRYGYNLTRGYTLIGQQQGHHEILSVGRVQTPILGLVVRRDRVVSGHRPQVYQTVRVKIAAEPDEPIVAVYQPTQTDAIDDKGRLIQAQAAQAILEKVRGQGARVASAVTKQGSTAPPLPHNLLSLQAELAGLWNMKPKTVLAVTQSLRDKHQAITYNRSDCRYLNEERHAEAPGLLEALAGMVGEQARKANPELKSQAWNSSKVTAHHAIIPTLKVPEPRVLSTDEERVYRRIVRGYLAQFYPPEQYRTTVVIWQIAGRTFKSTGRVPVSSGWRVLDDTGEDGEKESVDLEALEENSQGRVTDGQVREERTKPPARYSMKTLLEDLTRVARYVTDPAIRELLHDKDSGKESEAGGIGTPATRDSHLETLFARGFIVEEGKHVVSTSLGQRFHDALPVFAVTPDMTALWHEKQKQIEKGTLGDQVLIGEVDQAIAKEIRRIKEESAGLKVTDQGTANKHPCPVCRQGQLRPRRGRKGVFWGCSGYPDCKTTFPDRKGAPDQRKRTTEVSAEHVCPDCGKGLVRRPTKKPGRYWWGCSGFPGCAYRAFDNKGAPEKAVVESRK